MDTELERTRHLHAEIEQIKASMVRDLTVIPKGYTRELQQEQRTKAGLLKIKTNTEKLMAIYEDQSGRRSDELSTIYGRGSFNLFKERVREMRSYHKKHPMIGEAPVEEHIPKLDLNVNYTGEEMNGRFFDFHKFHERFLNMRVFRQDPKNPIRVDYPTFLNRVFEFWRVKRQLKGQPYLEFYRDLMEYLIEFWDRTRLLYPSSKVLGFIKADFDRRWAARDVEGWHKPWTRETKGKYKLGKLYGEPSVEDDEMDEEGEEFQGPLYCSVLLKNFSDYTFFESRKNGKKFKKYSRRMKCEDPICREVAWIEARIGIFIDLMEDNLKNTLEYIEKKQTRSYREIQEALEEAERPSTEEEEEDEDEETEAIYNPLRIPLDFDGKPIPYWLYKLRGLNRYFHCEICGGHQYRGPQAFHRHFREWRHAHGMRTLGIPNTKDFHLVTGIDDAIALYEKLKRVKTTKNYQPEDEEEFEDINGTVFRKRDYDRLVRQGIL